MPSITSDSLNFNYSPTDPSPTIGGPTLKKGLKQGPYDQRDSVEKRNDILIYSTGILTQNMVMKGSVAVHLKVSSNRKDADFGIRLTDVYPDGRSMIVNDGIMRMRFRNGNNTVDTSAMIPGTIYNCNISLPNTAITFLAGHKIRIDITSSNYPRFNRNMNTGEPMYPGNSMDSLVNPLMATNTVYSNSINASYISLPLVGFNGINSEGIVKEGIKVYPNPAKEELTVTSKEMISGIKIRNPIGQTIFENYVLLQNEIKINCSLIPNGIYFIEVQTAEGYDTQKIIIQH
jgi:hypothetical protein